MAKIIFGSLERKEEALYEHIEFTRKKKNITADMLLDVLGLKSRNNYYYRVKHKTFTVRELLILMKFLTWTDEEIMYYLGTQAGR